MYNIVKTETLSVNNGVIICSTPFTEIYPIEIGTIIGSAVGKGRLVITKDILRNSYNIPESSYQIIEPFEKINYNGEEWGFTGSTKLDLKKYIPDSMNSNLTRFYSEIYQEYINLFMERIRVLSLSKNKFKATAEQLRQMIFDMGFAISIFNNDNLYNLRTLQSVFALGLIDFYNNNGNMRSTNLIKLIGSVIFQIDPTWTNNYQRFTLQKETDEDYLTSRFNITYNSVNHNTVINTVDKLINVLNYLLPAHWCINRLESSVVNMINFYYSCDFPYNSKTYFLKMIKDEDSYMTREEMQQWLDNYNNN
jgi:hypothetical protein